MAKKDVYYILVNDECKLFDLETLIRFVQPQPARPLIWSARLSTGLVGRTGCQSGNRGPKNQNEVLLAVGDAGLRRLIALGFITCPTCLPEKIERFWRAARGAVRIKYGITLLDDFIDKKVLPFDARRVVWEKVVPILKHWPDRLYVPPGLQHYELEALKRRFEKIGYGLSSVGYSNPEAAGRFTGYELT